MSLITKLESLAKSAEPVVAEVAKAVEPVAEQVAAPVVQAVEQAAPAAVEQAAAPVVQAVEQAAPAALSKIFDSAVVDIRNELPELVAALGVNTSDGNSVLHATVVLLASLLATYGPAEIRSVLQGKTPAA